LQDEQQGTAQGVRWYTADPAALDQLTPDGETEQPHDASWTIDPEGKSGFWATIPIPPLSKGKGCVLCLPSISTAVSPTV
jgi:hypothetical protein